jgi:hypothetical protein
LRERERERERARERQRARERERERERQRASEREREQERERDRENCHVKGDKSGKVGDRGRYGESEERSDGIGNCILRRLPLACWVCGVCECGVCVCVCERVSEYTLAIASCVDTRDTVGG